MMLPNQVILRIKHKARPANKAIAIVAILQASARFQFTCIVIIRFGLAFSASVYDKMAKCFFPIMAPHRHSLAALVMVVVLWSVEPTACR